MGGFDHLEDIENPFVTIWSSKLLNLICTPLSLGRYFFSGHTDGLCTWFIIATTCMCRRYLTLFDNGDVTWLLGASIP